MSRNDTILSAEQSTLIQLLIAGKSQAEAAKELGINIKTVQRWLKLPHVAEAYRQVKEDVATHVREQIKALSTKALTALEESLTGRSALVKFQASTYILNRVAPEEVLTQAQTQDAIYDASLTAYMEPDELDQLERIIARAQQRKQEAEEKITPMRKLA